MSWLAEPQLATQLFHRLRVRLRAIRASKRRLEARGVEPLSSSLSAQTSTRLSGEKF